MKRSVRLETNAPLERGGPLRATKWGTRPKTKRASWRDEFMPGRAAEKSPKHSPFELAWFAFVRSLGCYCTHLGGCRGAVQASHVALSANEKGVGMKVSFQQTVPHCDRHHRAWDGRLGVTGNPFAGMSKDERYALASEWVRDVVQAATPGDSLDDARELERLGLGKVVGNGRDGWQWLPGSWTEVEAGALTGAVSA